MHPVYESELVLPQIRKACPRSVLLHVVEQPQPLEGGDPVQHPPVRRLQAVREAKQEARHGQQRQQDQRQRPRHGVAGAVVGEHRRQQLEGQQRAGREEVRQVGGGG